MDIFVSSEPIATVSPPKPHSGWHTFRLNGEARKKCLQKAHLQDLLHDAWNVYLLWDPSGRVLCDLKVERCLELAVTVCHDYTRDSVNNSVQRYGATRFPSVEIRPISAMTVKRQGESMGFIGWLSA
jgi:hypothetical protein